MPKKQHSDVLEVRIRVGPRENGGPNRTIDSETMEIVETIRQICEDNRLKMFIEELTPTKFLASKIQELIEELIETDNSGQSSKFDDTISIERFEDIVGKRYILTEEKRGKRIYRRPKELPDPSKPSSSDVNRMTSKLQTRISDKHIELFNRCTNHFENQKETLEAAIEHLAEALDQ